MPGKQLNLFGEEVQPEKKDSLENDILAAKHYIPFLPAVEAEECYLDIDKLDALQDIANKCQGCRLRSTCRQVIFGEGKEISKLMLIGEGPGKDEDIQGSPFVGRAGQLLDKILQAAELPRQDLYITNVVKCRPPGNRLPNPDEVKICRNYLEAQIRIINPSIIVCLGAMASKAVIAPGAKISELRGKWFQRKDIRIMATYHPAALLRNENYKRPVWEDFKFIRDEFKKIDGQ